MQHRILNLTLKKRNIVKPLSLEFDWAQSYFPKWVILTFETSGIARTYCFHSLLWIIWARSIQVDGACALCSETIVDWTWNLPVNVNCICMNVQERMGFITITIVNCMSGVDALRVGDRHRKLVQTVWSHFHLNYSFNSKSSLCMSFM